ncbi:MAG: choice-of-anchor J domain-containing protein [Bacteroidota bacterium]|nr:choice-of-anchor J domain-containing protein [Bacteroidota bacterium]
MSYNRITVVIVLMFIIVLCLSCEKDSTTAATSNNAPASSSWTEEFDDVSGLGTRGWVISNNSDQVGPEAWRRGRYESANKAAFVYNSVIGFPAYTASKSPNDFISCDFYAGTNVSNMSVWLISPVTKMKNGDQLIFYTRSAIDSGSYFLKNNIDRLQVRLNLANEGTYTGNSWTTTGDFNTLLLDINPSLADGGYPSQWTQFKLTLSGINGTASGRIAFRYFVPNGGPDGPNAGMVGIDAVSFTSK